MELSPGSVSARTQARAGQEGRSTRCSCRGCTQRQGVARLRGCHATSDVEPHCSVARCWFSCPAVHNCCTTFRLGEASGMLLMRCTFFTHPCPAGWAPGWRRVPGTAGGAPPRSQCPAQPPPERLQQGRGEEGGQGRGQSVRAGWGASEQGAMPLASWKQACRCCRHGEHGSTWHALNQPCAAHPPTALPPASHPHRSAGRGQT